MTVYLIHLQRPVPRGVTKDGKELLAQHYLGVAEDLVERIMQHMETIWVPLDEPEILENGGIRKGTTHGPGATFMGFVNYLGVDWKLARTWPGAGKDWEKKLKDMKCTPDLCPECNPRAYRRANRIFM